MSNDKEFDAITRGDPRGVDLNALDRWRERKAIKIPPHMDAPAVVEYADKITAASEAAIEAHDNALWELFFDALDAAEESGADINDLRKELIRARKQIRKPPGAA